MSIIECHNTTPTFIVGVNSLERQKIYTTESVLRPSVSHISVDGIRNSPIHTPKNQFTNVFKGFHELQYIKF